MGADPRLNRTFYGIETGGGISSASKGMGVLIVPFMELKHGWDLLAQQTDTVLIVPFMELKQKR